MQTPLGLLFNQTHLGFVVHDELETYNDVGPDTGENQVQLVIFELVEEFAVDNGKSYLARGSVYHVGLSDQGRSIIEIEFGRPKRIQIKPLRGNEFEGSLRDDKRLEVLERKSVFFQFGGYVHIQYAVVEHLFRRA